MSLVIFTSLIVWTVSGVLWAAGAVVGAAVAVWWFAAERFGWFEPVELDGDQDDDDQDLRPVPMHRHRLVGVAGVTRHDEYGRVRPCHNEEG